MAAKTFHMTKDQVISALGQYLYDQELITDEDIAAGCNNLLYENELIDGGLTVTVYSEAVG